MSDLPLSGYRVLIIEDDVHLAHSIQRALTSAGAQCQWTGDAVGGLSEFKSSEPHLVLLSLDAVGMHGHDVCHVLREISRVPVILMCPGDDRDAQIKGFHCGADDCVIKPVDPTLMVTRVMAHLRRAYHYNQPLPNTPKTSATVKNEGAPLPADWMRCENCSHQAERSGFEKTGANKTFLACPYCGEPKRLISG